MAREIFSHEIESRKIFVHTQKTQTIKICLIDNLQGRYEKYYRVDSNSIIDEAVLNNFDNLNDLENYIINNLNGRRESKKEYTSEKPIISTYNPIHDSDLIKIKEEVDDAIDTFIDEFIDFPYLHRAEHSIHTQLFHIMMNTKYNFLSKKFPMANGKTETLLVHKEWPWPIINNSRRTTFDFAVLTPDYLKNECATISKFKKGHSCPPIIIEIGMDYGFAHLKKDKGKLDLFVNHNYYGYLIHLYRRGRRKDDVEDFIKDTSSSNNGGTIEIAYVLVTDKITRYKKIKDKSIIQK